MEEVWEEEFMSAGGIFLSLSVKINRFQHCCIWKNIKKQETKHGRLCAQMKHTSVMLMITFTDGDFISSSFSLLVFNIWYQISIL